MAKVHKLDGAEKEDIELPTVFEEDYRPDLIKRAVLSYQSRRRQAYGSDDRAGLKTSAHYEGKRHLDRSVQMMNREMSRMPRQHGDTARRFRGMKAPHAVGGRRAHPPKAEKKYEKKMNKKERRKAVRSALAATGEGEFVEERDHIFDAELPIVVEDGIQSITKTDELIGTVENLGLGEDLERAGKKKIRAGKGTMRGRKYRTKKSLLIVVDEDKGVSKAAGNIPGVEVSTVENLNAELLSPGAHGARLTLYSKSALEKIDERWSV